MKTINIFIFLCLSLHLKAYPLATSWHQINTPHFQIIYPFELEKLAQRTANLLEHIYHPTSKALNYTPAKIAIVLHNKTIESNAFVHLTPKSAHFITTPPQSWDFTNEWINGTAIHEFRHIVQFDKLQSDYYKIIYYLFGELGVSIFIKIFTPDWYLEGDAVDAETYLTKGGRGRIPEFILPIRANVLAGKDISYDNAYLGYHDPNISVYALGYLLITHIKRKYGNNKWNYVWDGYTLEDITKKDIDKIYKDTIDDLWSIWIKQIDGLKLTPATVISQSNDPIYTNYYKPHFIDQNKVVAFKSGYGDITSLVIVDSQGQEETIAYPNIGPKEFSVNKDKVLWNEYITDPRWEHVSNTEIRILNINSKKITSLAHKKRFFAPALSPDGKTIIVVHVSEDSQYRLVLLDAKTGEEIKRLSNPENEFLITPKWLKNNKKIVVVKVHPLNGQTLAIVDLKTGQHQNLLPYSFDTISSPFCYGSYIFFNYSYSGIDNIYAYNLNDQSVYQVTSRKLGAFDAAVSEDGQTIIFSDYTPNGRVIAKMPFNPPSWIPLEQVEIRKINYSPATPPTTSTTPTTNKKALKSNDLNIFQNITVNKYPSQEYSVHKNIINIHSWGIDPIMTLLGNTLNFGIQSKDVLDTTNLILSYEYDLDYKTNRTTIDTSYKGFYPILTISGNLGERRFVDEYNNEHIWTENKINWGVLIPLFKSITGGYLKTIDLTTSFTHGQISNKDFWDESYSELNGSLHAINYGLALGRMHKPSLLDLKPPWGQTIHLRYHHTPLGGDNSGSLFTIDSTFLFPGLTRFHSFSFDLDFFYQQIDEFYLFENDTGYIRGYGVKPHKELIGTSFNYLFPVFYPDYNFFSYIYFKRINTNLFIDYGQSLEPHHQKTYQSSGIEITSNINLFRIKFPFMIGMGFYFLPDGEWLWSPQFSMGGVF